MGAYIKLMKLEYKKYLPGNFRWLERCRPGGGGI